jgi:hypothetical protein
LEGGFMPLIRIDIIKGKSKKFKKIMLEEAKDRHINEV